MFDGIKKAIAAGVARWTGTFVGGIVAGFIFTHAGVLDFLNSACASLSSPQALTGAFGAVAVALSALFFGVKDKTNVGAKMAITAKAAFETGVEQGAALEQVGVGAQAVTDSDKVAAVADAMKTADESTKTDKAAVITALKTGTF